MPKKISAGVVHELPSDMRKLLQTDESLLERWEDLTPLARNEWICWTITNKKPETRQKHLDQIPGRLLRGQRRPCCWVGCLHREK